MPWPAACKETRETYLRDGFAIARGLLTSQESLEVVHELNRYIDQVVPTLPAMDVFYEDKDARSQIRMLPRMHEHDAHFQAMLTSGTLPELAECLLGTEAVPHDTAYFNKLPEVGEATPPHQDGFYFHLDPCEAVTLWLALDDVDEQNACVLYVPGSHRRGMREHARTRVLGFSQGIVDYGEADRSSEVAACVRPGDVIAHDAMTVHRTNANRSPRTRRALGFVYFSDRARIDEAARTRYQQMLEKDLAAKGRI